MHIPSPASVPSPYVPPTGAAWSLLPHTGYLDFDGVDATSFLQGQLSNDVAALAVGDAQWSSYNSPKGRMLASMLLWRASATSYRAFVAADLAPTLRQRLAIFVMRAKLVVTDRSVTGICVGVTGATAGAAVQAALGVAPDAGHGVTHDEVDIVATPDGRVLIHVPTAARDAIADQLAAHATAVEWTYWDWAAIAAGIPTIGAATQDQFVPQTLNWDLVGGVNFRKGCYPGQEIVARMQYLGRQKERLLRLHIDGAVPAIGTRLYSAVFGDQACGTIVNAAPAPTGGSDLLAVAQISATHDASLHLGALEGPVVSLLPLPYAIPAPVAPNRPKLT
ncbi:MAG: folate-binding protein [Betaproteobacteria bacterium]